MAPSLNLAAGASMAGVPDDVRPLNSVGRQGVRMTDDSLLSMVLVEDVQTGRLPSGSAEIAVRLTNCTATPLQVEGATQFLGPTGAQTEPPTVWQRIFLPPRTSRVYQATSTGPRTAAMAVDLREGR